eukprot:1651593-Amphidinium_carterae.1
MSSLWRNLNHSALLEIGFVRKCLCRTSGGVSPVSSSAKLSGTHSRESVWAANTYSAMTQHNSLIIAWSSATRTRARHPSSFESPCEHTTLHF